MDSVSPVFTEEEISAERVIALGQEEYFPIIICRVMHEGQNGLTTNASYCRFRFTYAERSLIAAGADLILGQPHHGPMMPVSLQLAMPGEWPKEGQ